MHERSMYDTLLVTSWKHVSGGACQWSIHSQEENVYRWGRYRNSSAPDHVYQIHTETSKGTWYIILYIRFFMNEIQNAKMQKQDVKKGYSYTVANNPPLEVVILCECFLYAMISFSHLCGFLFFMFFMLVLLDLYNPRRGRCLPLCSISSVF